MLSGEVGPPCSQSDIRAGVLEGNDDARGWPLREVRGTTCFEWLFRPGGNQ